MKKSEYLMKSLVTRLNGLINGRHIDELDESEYSLFEDRLYALRLIANVYGHDLLCQNRNGRYVFTYVSADNDDSERGKTDD